MEFRNTETDDDFLVYGLPPDFLQENEDIFRQPLREAVRRFHQAGAAVFQAHPVRMRLAVPLGRTLFTDFGQAAMLELLAHGAPVPRFPFPHPEEAFRRPQQLCFLRVCDLREPDCLDGIEIYNGNNHWVQDPAEIGAILRRYPRLIGIAGSDFHESCHLARGGTAFPTLPRDEKELADMLRNGKIGGLRIAAGAEVRV